MRIIGLMSGTSADGIDVAICNIEGEPPKLKATVEFENTYPHAPDFQRQILDACIPSKSSVDMLCGLNVDIGLAFSKVTLDAIQQADLTIADIDLIASHGQTIWHQVEDNGDVSSTLQIGESAVIAEKTGITTISNFRARDVVAGGQGAPLIGYVDWLLLRHPTRWRAVQNIGGMANVTCLPPLNDEESSAPLAFDTGPGNALIDTMINILTGGEEMYDPKGAYASRGNIEEYWLADLLDHPYYRRKPPKTTGREMFGSMMVDELLETVRTHKIPIQDVMATLTMLTAQTIVDAYRNYAPARIDEVIIGGGGKHNHTMIDMLRSLMGNVPILTHEDIGIDGDSKEALAFAVLGHETWHNRQGNMPTLTGASRPVVLGDITPSENFATLLKRTWTEQE